MAIGDRITSARTAGFMRRINALEHQPRPTVLARGVSGDMPFDIDPSTGLIWFSGAGTSPLVADSYQYQRSPLSVVSSVSTMPGARGDSGTTTSTTTNKLVDSGQNFTTTVIGGDTVRNITDGTWTTVSAVDSNTVLSLNHDIMATGEEYSISEVVDSGTATSTTTNKLVQSGQNFTITVKIGDTVRNITDGTVTTVTAVDSNTVLSLDADIMATGEVFSILSIYEKFLDPIFMFNGFIYSSLAGSSISKFKYSISGDEWTDMTATAESTFTTLSHDGSVLYSISTLREIDTFNTSGVSQSTISLGQPPSAPSETGWSILSFDFNSSGDMLVVYRIDGSTTIYVTKYDTDGTHQAGGFNVALSWVLTPSGGTAVVQCDNASDNFVIANVGLGAATEDKSTSYDSAGLVLADPLMNVSGIQVMYGLRYHGSEIYTLVSTTLRVFDSDGVLLDSVKLVGVTFDTDSSNQTTWYQYPTPGNDTGKVSLGTVDGGVTVPVNAALQGLRPHYFELRDMRDAIEAEASNRRVVVDSGTTTSTTANKLVQTGQNFTTTVSIGDTVRNISDATTADVTAIDSDTTLSLDADIMVTGEQYEISSTYITTGSTSSNIFIAALGSEDWTTPTVTHKSRIREDYYSDIDTVLTKLEASLLT